MYIIIKKSKSTTTWYADKINIIYKIDQKISLPDLYTIRISYRKDKVNYGTISLDDAEVIYPTKSDKIKIFFRNIKLRFEQFLSNFII